MYVLLYKYKLFKGNKKMLRVAVGLQNIAKHILDSIQVDMRGKKKMCSLMSDNIISCQIVHEEVGTSCN